MKKFKKLHVGTEKYRGFGVNFTNIFMRRFYVHRSQKRKITNDLTAFFTLLEYARVKVARKTLMQLTLVEQSLLGVGSVVGFLAQNNFRYSPDASKIPVDLKALEKV
jgi:hypothetical protein